MGKLALRRPARHVQPDEVGAARRGVDEEAISDPVAIAAVVPHRAGHRLLNGLDDLTRGWIVGRVFAAVAGPDDPARQEQVGRFVMVYLSGAGPQRRSVFYGERMQDLGVGYVDGAVGKHESRGRPGD